jgi:putative PIN family toxin of toxin-antitoxin system
MFVLDSNVLVAGLFSRRGASFKLLERAIDGRLPVAVSVALALEYEDVLFRKDIRIQSWASAEEIDAVLNAILAAAKLVQPIRSKLRPALPDAGDDMVLECAVEAGASAIVTMNTRDFLAAAAFGIDVVKPGALVAALKEKEA